MYHRDASNIDKAAVFDTLKMKASWITLNLWSVAHGVEPNSFGFKWVLVGSWHCDKITSMASYTESILATFPYHTSQACLLEQYDSLFAPYIFCQILNNVSRKMR